MEKEFIMPVCDIYCRREYIAVVADWERLNLHTRKKLVITYLNKSDIDYENQWYYFAVIIPLLDGIAVCENAFVFLNEFQPKPNSYAEKELLKFISSDGHIIESRCQKLNSITANMHFELCKVIKFE